MDTKVEGADLTKQPTMALSVMHNMGNSLLSMW